MICRPGAAAAAAEGLSRSLAGGFNPGPDLEFNLTTSRTRKLKPERPASASVQRPLRRGGAGNSHSSTSLQGLHSLAVQLASELEA